MVDIEINLESKILCSEIVCLYWEGGIFEGGVGRVGCIIVCDNCCCFFSVLESNVWFVWWDWYFFFV